METGTVRLTALVWRLAVVLMVIALSACDNVEWGGVEIAVVPPPPKVGPVSGTLGEAEPLPRGAILYRVTRDSTEAVAVPVAEVVDQETRPIRMGSDPQSYGDRFIASFLRNGAELTLFHTGRRAGTLIVDSAAVRSAGCGPVPVGLGHAELSPAAGSATEFLAMARTQAPQGRMLAPDSLRVEPRMQVVGNILAETLLRNRHAQLPNWSRARRQIFPFPVQGSQDLGFTATFLVDDALQVGGDDEGYSLYVVYTPQAQTYDTAYVDYTSYTASGKAARRTVDFLDWNRDGDPELLVQVYGTRNTWFTALGKTDHGWARIMDDRCSPATPPDSAALATPDSAAADSVKADSAVAQHTTTPRSRPSTPARTGAAARQARPQPALPDIEPTVQLSVPGTRRARTNPPRPDSGGGLLIRPPRT